MTLPRVLERGDAQVVYHVDLRQFPHNACRFNLTRQELEATVVEPWAREQWIEMGERKWSPHQAKLTILEGPHIPVEQLSMGRGWRVAQRQAHDVTERMLAAARDAASPQSGVLAAPTGKTQPSQDDALLADSLGLELLTVLGAAQAPLRRAWELACARYPERTVGQSLVLAEHAVSSLLDAGLVVLIRTDSTGLVQGQVGDSEVQAVLRAIDSWTGDILALARR